VPISRRGLTAAGLALATVSALGVTSTLNASAEQVPTIQPAAEVPSTETSDVPPPPPPPPPADAKAETGLAAKGISGRAVGGSVKPSTPKVPVFAAEGVPLPVGATAAKPVAGPSLRTQSSGGVSVLSAPGTGGSNYFWAQGSQSDIVADGTYATMTIGKPTLGDGESHTLAEIAVRSKDGKQIIEVGWRIAPDDDQPRLFVYHWVNGIAQGWDNPGYMAYVPPPSTTPPTKPLPKVGDALDVGVAKQFSIRYDNRGDGYWWVGHDRQWFGYFPDSLWKTTPFRKVEVAQWYGEVTVPKTVRVPCSEMGTGITAAEADAAEIRNIGFITINANGSPVNGVPAANILLETSKRYYGEDVTPSKDYAVLRSNPPKNSLFYGGPGASDEAREAAGLPPC
jgi:hypothetical protein